MNNKEVVIGLLARRPEDASLDETARDSELLTGVRTARARAQRREGIAAHEARNLVDLWRGKKSSPRSRKNDSGAEPAQR